MSSSIKRVALVAVTALGFGMLTTVAANATAGDIVVTTAVSKGTATPTNETATATAGANNYVAFTVAATNGSPLSVQVTGGTASSTDTATTGSGTSSLLIGSSVTTGAIPFTVPTPTVGTITVKVYGFSSGVLNTTATSKLTITVNAAATGVGVLSVGNSSSYISDSATSTGTLTPDATDFTNLVQDKSVVASKALSSGSPVLSGYVAVTLKDSQTTPAAMGSKTVSATISGSGLLQGNSGTLTTYAGGISRSVSGTTDASGRVAFGVYSDGTAGVGTITISYTDAAYVTTTIATETITFFGAAASITPTVAKTYIASSGSAWPTGTISSTNYAVKLQFKDSAGNPVGTAQTITATSSDVTKIASSTCTQGTGSKVSYYYCSVTGVSGASGAASVTYSIGSTATADYLSAKADFVVSSLKASTLTITADSSVAGGQLITYTITAKDAAGNPIPDGAAALDYLAASPTVSGGALQDYASLANAGASSNAVTALFTGATFANGVATDTVQAPFGSTTITADFYNTGTAGVVNTKLATALNAVETLVKTTVGSDALDAVDAANEATDAANAATDAANAAAEAADAATAAAQDAQAAVAALATQVASLIAGIKAQITTLTNLVIKIQKKVKA